MDKNKLNKELNKVIDYFQSSLSKIQTWKASTGVLEDLEVYVPSWGQMQKIQALWNVSLMDAQTLKIESWDKSVLPHIEKGIYESGLGFTPVNQWEWIMVKIPPMTQERRQEIAKLVKKELEEMKIRARQIRHDFLKDIKTDFDNKEITEDEKKQYEKELDDTIKNYNKKLEEIKEEKEKSILNIN